MTTVRDLIYDALSKINVVGIGQPLNAEDEQAAFRTLNDLLESWSVEGGLVYTQTEETFNLVSGQQDYTIGVGGEFNTVQPFEIVALTTKLGDSEYTATQYGETDWAAIQDKADSAGIPEVFYYNNNSPIGTIKFYPIPTGVTSTTIFSRKAITSFTSINNTVELPAGYRRALVYNLAVELAPSYEKEAGVTVKQVAIKSKSNVFSYNARNNVIRSKLTSALFATSENDHFNIYTGQYN